MTYVKNNGGVAVGMVGFDGGKVKNIVDFCIHVKTEIGEYGVVEDIHNIIAHTVASYFYR